MNLELNWGYEVPVELSIIRDIKKKKSVFEKVDVMSLGITLRQQSRAAIQHLTAAARFSRQCGNIQKEHERDPLGSFFDEQIACVSATILLCVASLESNINEYLSGPAELFPEYAEYARLQFCELVSELPILQKYNRVLLFKGLQAIDAGARPYQDVDVLIAVRNELVHFHPEWHDQQERHRKLGQRLMYRFEMSPFIEDSAPIFPQKFISHGCTKWAVESSRSFMDLFAATLGLSSRFESFNDRLVP